MADDQGFPEGDELEEFLEDRPLHCAIEWAPEIIGEASSTVAEDSNGRELSSPGNVPRARKDAGIVRGGPKGEGGGGASASRPTETDQRRCNAPRERPFGSGRVVPEHRATLSDRRLNRRCKEVFGPSWSLPGRVELRGTPLSPLSA